MQARQQRTQVGFGGGAGGVVAGGVLPVADTGKERTDAALAHGEAVYLYFVLVVGKDVLGLHRGGSCWHGRPVWRARIGASAV